MIGGTRKTKLLKIMAANGIIQSEKGIEKTKIGATAEPMHPKALKLKIYMILMVRYFGISE